MSYSSTSLPQKGAARASRNLLRAPEKLPQPENLTTQKLGPWALGPVLGQGALTRVYLARPADTQSAPQGQYALKLLRDEWSNHPLAIARMRREAIVGQAVAHRRIISVLSSHVHRPPYYVVMPRLEGGDLGVQLAIHGRIEVGAALWIARQAAEGLDALHTSGYLHGDLKPRNLFINSDGEVTLLDLTCARRIDEPPMIDETPIIGTPIYLAPEIFAGRPADARSDLYSLGIILFEMLAGRLPILSNSLETIGTFKMQSAIPSVRIFAPHVSHQVAEFIRRLTAREPLRRPSSAREVARNLVRLEIANLAMRLPA
jgi:serine/threonine-protein kinase